MNPNEDLRKLEDYIMKSANELGIGTMGFGGETTLLGCKIGVMHRIPASFFVSVAYNCWAFRRLGVKVNPETGEINEWLYQEGEKIDFALEAEKAAKDEVAAAAEPTLKLPVKSPCKHQSRKNKSAN